MVDNPEAMETEEVGECGSSSAMQWQQQTWHYTSLKDIMENSSSKNSLLCYEGMNNNNNNHEMFDSSNISIRNELVKRAASVYLQSAALLVTRNDNIICFRDFWDNLNTTMASFASFCSCCVSSFFHFLTNICSPMFLPNSQPHHTLCCTCM